MKCVDLLLLPTSAQSMCRCGVWGIGTVRLGADVHSPIEGSVFQRPVPLRGLAYGCSDHVNRKAASIPAAVRHELRSPLDSTTGYRPSPYALGRGRGVRVATAEGYQEGALPPLQLQAHTLTFPFSVPCGPTMSVHAHSRSGPPCHQPRQPILRGHYWSCWLLTVQRDGWEPLCP